MTQPSTLTELQSHIATACQLGNPELACSAGNYTLANQQEAQRAFSDRMTALFVRETHDRSEVTPEQAAKIERKLTRKAERFEQRHKIQRRADTSEKCGFVVIGLIFSGLVSWLLGKVFQALWDWWFKAKATAKAAIGRTLATCGSLADDDDEDD